MDKENMEMYSEAHGSYDFTNHLLSFFTDTSMRERTAEEVLRSKPAKVLDIATGTGDTALIIAKNADHYKCDVEVTAMDVNRLMLSTAIEKACKEGISNVHFERGDILKLKYPNKSFDAVVCTFALKNLDLKRFASESYRVLKKGGKLVIADISMPEGLLNRFVFRIYASYMGLFGVFTGKKLYRWLPGSTSSFDKKGFMRLMERSRFSGRKVREFFFGIAYIITYTK